MAAQRIAGLENWISAIVVLKESLVNNYTPPPIPDPFQAPFQAPPLLKTDGDWQNAPKIIKNWAYQVTWLGIIFFSAAIFIVLLDKGKLSPAEKIGGALFYAALLAVEIWLNRALKKGTRAGWTVQLIVSILSLCLFPLGTAIHAYILSQWSKPENKAWFGLT